MPTIGSSVGLAMTSEHIAAAPSEQAPVTASVAAVLQQEKTSRAGLSSAEAAHRLAQYGPNAIADRTESKWHRLAAYFLVPMPILIETPTIIYKLQPTALRCVATGRTSRSSPVCSFTTPSSAFGRTTKPRTRWLP